MTFAVVSRPTESGLLFWRRGHFEREGHIDSKLFVIRRGLGTGFAERRKHLFTNLLKEVVRIISTKRRPWF